MKNIRTKLAMNQEQFSKLVGVSRMTLWRWENGQSHPTANKAREIIKILERQGIEPQLAKQELIQSWIG